MIGQINFAGESFIDLFIIANPRTFQLHSKQEAKNVKAPDDILIQQHGSSERCQTNHNPLCRIRDRPLYNKVTNTKDYRLMQNIKSDDRFIGIL